VYSGGDAEASSKIAEVVNLLAVAPHGEALNPNALAATSGIGRIIGAINGHAVSLLG